MTDSNLLAAQGRIYRAQQDHRNARRAFEEIPLGERSAPILAVLGATYADLAYENLIRDKDEYFWIAAVKNLEDALKENPNYRWAWAQLGETYRRIANAYAEIPGRKHQVPNIEREATTLEVFAFDFTQNKGGKTYDLQTCLYLPDFHNYLAMKIEAPKTLQTHSLNAIYKEAEECFKKAVTPGHPLTEQDAWSLVHWGATIVNSRGGSDDDTQKIEAYEQALEKFKDALTFKKQQYPWCWAFKFAAHVLLNVVHARRERHVETFADKAHHASEARHHAEQAYKSLFIAIIQDKNLFDKIDVPLGAFGEDQPPILLHAKTMVMLARGANQWREYESSKLYESYFYEVTKIYEERDLKISDDEIRARIAKVKKELKEELEGSYDLDVVLQAWGWTGQLPNDPGMYKELYNLLNPSSTQNEQSAQKEWVHLFYLKGGLKALELAISGNQDNKAVKSEALQCLAASLTLAPDDQLSDQARRDIAWYYLRGDNSFQRLIGARQT